MITTETIPNRRVSPGLFRRGAPVLWAAAIALAAALGIGCQGGREPGGKSAGDGATSEAARPARTDSAPAARDCAPDNAGLTLPEGFCATIFADHIGHARHVVATAEGVVYVNTWSGRYYPGSPPPEGSFVVALRDLDADGRADSIVRFGPTAAEGATGGTGIGIHRGGLYVDTGERIVRYALPGEGLAPTGTPETVVRGLPLDGDHPMHPFAIDSSGGIYVNLGSATNACEMVNRALESPGHRPCKELETRGGVWRYDAGGKDQSFSPSGRYATGIRDAIGLAMAPDGAVYVTQHGRDQLRESWPKLYDQKEGANQPAEELLRLEQGGDYGWPTCYFDVEQAKLVLAPEYGGDGGEAVGDCAKKLPPVVAFPAHWAPDGLLFYTGSGFPARYHGGAFIAFHGSWNRTPLPQEGYQVTFVSFEGGKPSGRYEVFADGFAEGRLDPSAAAHRPVGLAQGPAGELYITDDQAGRVWRVVYRGPGTSGPGMTPEAPGASDSGATTHR